VTIYRDEFGVPHLYGRSAEALYYGMGYVSADVTDSPVGMIFPHAPGNLPRHPSQLYEALFEGVVLCAVLWFIRKRAFAKGSFAGFYLFGYGFFRFFIEYFREPDAHLGLLWFGAFSQGQMLCLAMMAAGAGFVWWRARAAKISA
jgi:phosphatidylglycerol:prolipoprotein diacylglycerol transferase